MDLLQVQFVCRLSFVLWILTLAWPLDLDFEDGSTRPSYLTTASSRWTHHSGLYLVSLASQGCSSPGTWSPSNYLFSVGAKPLLISIGRGGLWDDATQNLLALQSSLVFCALTFYGCCLVLKANGDDKSFDWARPLELNHEHHHEQTIERSTHLELKPLEVT